MSEHVQTISTRLPVGAVTGAGRTGLLTVIALGAFAANSLLCRLALSSADADPGSFTTIRLVSGAIMLFLLSGLCGTRSTPRRGNWRSAVWLFLYATAFSFAYVGLAAGTGALILFTAVQLTMIVTAVLSGERPGPFQLFGICTTLSGLVYLLLPGLSAPAPISALLMAVAGFSWGVYSLQGRSEIDPLAATTGNFLRAAALAVIFGLLLRQGASISATGVVLAATSGALASGLGYAVWYAALGGLTATRAATVQLSVPVIAALGGVSLLSEELTSRLVVSAVGIVAGIAVTLRATRRAYISSLPHHRCGHRHNGCVVLVRLPARVSPETFARARHRYICQICSRRA